MPTPPDDAPRSLRDNRYAIVRSLGEGGQGSTFEAVDKLRGKPVAIKRFRVRGAKSWKEVELAEREAKVLSSISHPNLPRYVEHFEEGGELFLVTEKIEGQSLAERKQAGRGLDEAEVIRFLRDASAALDYLHGRAPPVIHRDIKPSNVIRRPDGSFALIDFGSVRDRMKPAGGSTVVGTFGYMAPEQFQGRAMPASDVYAVATTALTLLTGVEPEDLPHRGLSIDVDAALAGRKASPELGRALAAMLDPDPDKRASRIAPLLEALERHAPPPRPTPPVSAADWGEQFAEALGETIAREALAHVQGRRQAREARRETRDERRESRREEREQRRQMKRDLKALRREEQWRAPAQGRPPIPGIILMFLVMGLSLAQVAVTVALRLVVPAVIMVLSLFFGKGMRPAARGVSEAGKRAVASIGRARDFLQGKPVAEEPAQIRVEVKDETPAEAEPRRSAEPPKPRVAVPADPVEEAEQAAEAELAAEQEAARAAAEKRQR